MKRIIFIISILTLFGFSFSEKSNWTKLNELLDKRIARLNSLGKASKYFSEFTYLIANRPKALLELIALHQNADYIYLFEDYHLKKKQARYHLRIYYEEDSLNYSRFLRGKDHYYTATNPRIFWIDGSILENYDLDAKFKGIEYCDFGTETIYLDNLKKRLKNLKKIGPITPTVIFTRNIDCGFGWEEQQKKEEKFSKTIFKLSSIRIESLINNKENIVKTYLQIPKPIQPEIDYILVD